MVTFAPEANVCTLSSVPEGVESDIAVIDAFFSGGNNKTMTPADAVTVSQLDITTVSSPSRGGGSSPVHADPVQGRGH